MGASPFVVQEATRKQLLARVLLSGISGSGKTMTALEIAFTLASDPSKIVVLDTEFRSSEKYVGEPRIDVLAGREIPGATFTGYRVIDLDPDKVELSVQNYRLAMKAALDAGAEVVVIDGISPAWDWILGQVDKWKKANPRTDQRQGWASVGTPQSELLTRSIVRFPGHLIATARAKSEWAQDERGRPIKIGMAAKTRDGFEFEFDLACRMQPKPVALTVEKTRMGSVGIGPDYYEESPGGEFAQRIAKWIGAGERPESQEVSASSFDADEGSAGRIGSGQPAADGESAGESNSTTAANGAADSPTKSKAKAQADQLREDLKREFNAVEEES